MEFLERTYGKSWTLVHVKPGTCPYFQFPSPDRQANWRLQRAQRNQVAAYVQSAFALWSQNKHNRVTGGIDYAALRMGIEKDHFRQALDDPDPVNVVHNCANCVFRSNVCSRNIGFM